MGVDHDGVDEKPSCVEKLQQTFPSPDTCLRSRQMSTLQLTIIGQREEVYKRRLSHLTRTSTIETYLVTRR